MTTLQYELEIKNGEAVRESGNFFKANPFQITIDSTVIDVKLIHDDHKEVVYEVTEGEKVLAHLEHPDYTPECEPAELANHLNPSNNQGETLIAALLRLGVSKGKWRAICDQNKATTSFQVKQPRFL